MINSNWKFYKGSVESGFSAKLDDSNWETVKLGHTWNNIDGQDGKPNNKDINDTDYYRGDGWYRKHLTFDENDKDKLIFLRFQGSNTITSVYVNEQLAGAHSGGYTAFCFDITPFIKIGTDNLIAVKVNNERCEAIAPLTADFTFYGGIYREIE
ncbi:MAG: beta galactosidase jelly roll domain-containing protein, partial [Eubacterium sp.]|nr:beta galactosidase jelly roll domain-containing protein [Eubacterium sp.]